LVRNADEAMLDACPHLEVLSEGECKTDNCPHLAIANDPVLQAKVEEAYDRTTINGTDMDGNPYSFTPQLNFGVIA
jgi:hypothetical protein